MSGFFFEHLKEKKKKIKFKVKKKKRLHGGLRIFFTNNQPQAFINPDNIYKFKVINVFNYLYTSAHLQISSSVLHTTPNI